MESYLKDVFNNFHIPIVYISIFFIINKIVSRFRPVTFITASEVERSLYAKESRLLYLTSRFIFNSFILGLFIFSMATSLPKVPYGNIFLISTGCILYIAFFCFLHLQNKRKRLGLLGSILSILYMIGWIMVFSLLVSILLNDIPINSSKRYVYILIIIISCVFSSVLQVLCRPILFLLKFSKTKYVYFEDENKLRWYILYSMNQKEIMVGDSYLPEACKKSKIILRDKLVERTLVTVDSDELRKNSLETELNKSKSFFLIIFSYDSSIRVTVNLANGEKVLLCEQAGTLKHARQVIAVYVLDKLNQAPLFIENEIKVIECYRKIGRTSEREKWSVWKFYDHLPREDKKQSESVYLDRSI